MIFTDIIEPNRERDIYFIIRN